MSTSLTSRHEILKAQCNFKSISSYVFRCNFNFEPHFNGQRKSKDKATETYHHHTTTTYILPTTPAPLL